MEHQKIQAFSVIGIAVRTTNENGQAAKDIPALWNTFITENIAAQIPGKTGSDIYCIYTGYVKDHTQPYTTIVGCKVENLNHIPAGMTGKLITAGTYTQFTAKGNLMEGAVFNAWENIWGSDLDRAFTADFEVYGEKAQNPANAEVDIFVAIN